MPAIIAVMAFVLSAMLAVKSALVARRAIAGSEAPEQRINWSAIFGISMGMLASALLVRPGGLLLASAAAVLFASLAQRYSGIFERLALVGGLTASAALIFVEGLALPFRLLPAI